MGCDFLIIKSIMTSHRKDNDAKKTYVLDCYDALK